MAVLTRKMQLERSSEYKCGYSHAECAFYRHGTCNISPSMTEREDFSYAWHEFMCGWNSAMKDISKE